MLATIRQDALLILIALYIPGLRTDRPLRMMGDREQKEETPVGVTPSSDSPQNPRDTVGQVALLRLSTGPGLSQPMCPSPDSQRAGEGKGANWKFRKGKAKKEPTMGTN